MHAWWYAKAAWCCTNEQLGCVAASSPPPPTTYPCAVGADDWQLRWGDAEREWCCANKGLGCSAASASDTPEPSSLTDTQTPSAQPPSAPYDCLDGLSNWDQSWPAAKQEWCCSHETLGCRPAGKTYDCGEDMEGWSDSKKDWCCKHKGRGCSEDLESSHDCAVGPDNDESKWTDAKRQWCCKTAQRGCADGAPGRPFDCRAGLLNWDADWSQMKKTWCCTHENVGCPAEAERYPEQAHDEYFDCGEDLDHDQNWSDQKQDWCCVHRGVGCKEPGDFSPSGKFEQGSKALRRAPAAPLGMGVQALAVPAAAGAVSLALGLAVFRACPRFGSSFAPVESDEHQHPFLE